MAGTWRTSLIYHLALSRHELPLRRFTFHYPVIMLPAGQGYPMIVHVELMMLKEVNAELILHLCTPKRVEAPPGQVKGGEIALPKCPNATPYPWLVVSGVVPRHQHRG